VSIRSLPSTLVATVAAAGDGAKALFDVKAMLDHYEAHGFVGNSRVLRMLLGREPISFLEAMKRDIAPDLAGTQ
jgi:hypothetical protein